MKKMYLRSTIFFVGFFTLAGLKLYAQVIPVLEPIGKHYKTLGALSSSANPVRASLDTVTFPWKEYSSYALSNSLMRSYYLSEEDEARLPALVKFPANSSDQTRAELDYLLQLQKIRTIADTSRALYIANIGSWPGIINPTDPDYNENRTNLFYIPSELGTWLNPDNFPAITQLLMNCIQDIRATEFRLKRHFKRPRPYHLEPSLNPVKRINSPSFVSGHVLWAYTEAYIFGEIIPGKRKQFLDKADEVRWSREVLGIHYPSDDEASRIIGWHLLNAWHKNPLFIADLEKAKIEWELKSKKY